MRFQHCLSAVFVLIFLGGCSEDEKKTIDGSYREISVAIEEHYAALTNGQPRLRSRAEEIMGKLLSMPDTEQRRSLLDGWRKAVLDFDYNKKPLIRNDQRRGWSLIGVEDMFRSVFPLAASTDKEKWGLRLDYLGWLRNVVRGISQKREYPRGVSFSARKRFSADRGTRKDLEKYLDWLNNYNWHSFKYENDLRWFEAQFADRAKHMSPEAKVSLTAEIEKYLGRKMRTERECDADSQTKRRVIFPYYVPAPEGLEEKWEGEFKYF